MCAARAEKILVSTLKKGPRACTLPDLVTHMREHTLECTFQVGSPVGEDDSAKTDTIFLVSVEHNGEVCEWTEIQRIAASFGLPVKKRRLSPVREDEDEV